MRLRVLVLLLGACFILALVNSQDDKKPRIAAKAYYEDGLDRLIESVSDLSHCRPDKRKIAFMRARKDFKRIEFIIAYFDSDWNKWLNGANLPAVDESNEQYAISQASGFQVLEELLFQEPFSQERWEKECSVLLKHCVQIKVASRNLTFSAQSILDAMLQELVRIHAMGLNGFDSPVAKQSIIESSWAFQSLLESIDFLKYLIQNQDMHVAWQECRQQLQNGVKSLEKASDFERFDRLKFLKEHLDPCFRSLSNLRNRLEIETYEQSSGQVSAINEGSRSLYDDGFLNRFFFIHIPALLGL